MTGQTKNNRTNESTAVKDELAVLREDLATLRGDMGDLLRSVVDLSKHTATDAKDRVSEEMRERLEHLQSRLGDAKDAGRRAVRGAQHTVEEHPLTSVGVAFGVGLLVGHLLRRS